jgi:hypothetical protein
MRYVDRNGNDISFDQFCRMTEARVAVTKMDRCTVSTVWVGVDAGDGRIFETAVIVGGDVEASERYRTELDAVKGHVRWVEAQS